MLSNVKEKLKDSPLGDVLLALVTPYRRQRDLRRWQKGGRVGPPPHFLKQRILRSYAQQSGLKILVETGTYLGDMVEANRNLFPEIYSIELSEDLYQRALERFRGVTGVHLYQGDSAKVLPEILRTVSGPCLFWLDGHYSAGITAKGDRETPVLDELRAIFGRWHDENILLIDDARCFNGQNDYPTLDELAALAQAHRPGLIFEVKDDIVRIHFPLDQRAQS